MKPKNDWTVNLIVLIVMTISVTGCVFFEKPKKPLVSETFKDSFYREFSEPLLEPDLESFNKFYCLNRPDWTSYSDICAEVDEARRKLRTRSK